MSQFVPHIRQDVSARGGPMTPPWYAWAQRIDDAVASGAIGGASAAEAIKAMARALGSPDGTVERIPPLKSGGVVVGSGSIRHAGSLADGLVTLGLDGDVDAPPPTTYYGTDATGAKTFHPVAEAFTPGDGIALTTDPATGVTDVALADLPDTGGGTLQKIARDAKGRVAGTSAATTSDLDEGDNLYYTPARADARVAAGIAALKAEADPFPVYTTTAEAASAAPVQSVNGKTGAVSLTAADVGADAAGSAAALLTGTITNGDATHAPTGDAVFDALALKAAIPAGYIDGLTMQWVSGTALTVSSGSAYIPASGNIVSVPTAIAKAGLSLSASTWYHVYLFLNAGTPDVEIVTTAPATAYSGTARSKTGDATRRYIGSIRTDGAGAIWRFQQAGERITYLENIDVLPFRVVVAGGSTTPATVSNADTCPETATAVAIFAFNASGVNHLKLSASDGPTLPGGFMAFVPASSAMVIDRMPLNAARGYVYAYDSAGGACFLYAAGYFFER